MHSRHFRNLLLEFRVAQEVAPEITRHAYLLWVWPSRRVTVSRMRLENRRSMSNKGSCMRQVARPVQGDYVMNRPSGNKTALVLCVTLFALALVALPALAQVTSGTIFGSVQDPTGAYVKDASVTIMNPANGLTRKVTTNDDGQFVAPNLLPGTYTITVEAQGFKQLETSGIVLSAADKLNAGAFTLTMGATQESVNVTADAGQVQLQSNSGERSDVITSKQLNDVAMNGRNVLDYMKLIPGVISRFDGHASGTGGLDAMNINGTRANQHEFTLDGASNVDTGNNGGTHVTINPDAIEEVKVLTSNYQAEFGKAAGGQIAITTKSGSNQWHGNGRFFHRHDSLNANEWFNKKDQLAGGNPNTPPLYRYNYIGYQVGGPIKKDKLFFFWSQEFYRQFIPIGTFQFYTPTDLERKGDFSQSFVPLYDSETNTTSPQPVVISGPGVTNNVITPTPEQQVVFTAVSQLLQLFPEANVPGYGTVNGQNYNYSTSVSGHDPRREDILRVDYQINSKHHLFGRWIHNSDTNSSPFTPFPGPFGAFACSSSIQFPGGCTQKHPGWNISANLISTITPTILNEFSVGPSHTLSLDEGTNGNISLSKNAITLPLLYPTDTIPDLNFGGLPNTSFGGGYLGATPWKQANTTININDNLTWVRRNHTLKFGFFYQRNRKDQISWGNINGQASFSQAPTSGGTCPDGVNCFLGDPLASALLGSFDSFEQDTSRPTGYFRYNQVEFYVQDTWKLTSKLTLDFGMRFAWIPPQYDARNQVALFVPSAYTRSGEALDGMKFADDGTLPKGGWDGRGLMPEPRFGFAYDVFSSHKTILRGGAGMMHDRVQGNLIYNPVFSNPKLVRKASFGGGNLADLSNPDIGNGVSDNILAASKSGQVPTVYSFSLGIQHEIARGTTLDLAYVGTLGRHLVTARNINTIPYGYTFSRAAQDPANYADYCANPDPGNPCTDGIPNIEPNLPSQYSAAGYSFSGQFAFGKPSYTDALLVPYSGYGAIEKLQFDGTSNYNSLQASLQRRFSQGLTLGAVYTWSKAMATANSDEDLQDPFFPRLVNYSVADWDRRHVFAINYVYDLPKLTKRLGGPKWLSYVTDNYQLSGVTQVMSGAPQPLTDWTLGNGWFEQGAILGTNFAWDSKIPSYVFSLDKSGNPILPPVGQPVRFPRDQVRTGGLQNWDTSLFKNIPLGERYSIQLRLEAFNVFNHPNFDTKNFSVNFTYPAQWDMYAPYAISKGGTWGTPASTYSGAGGPRVVQLGAKFYF
jgi:hypothetical protein